MEMWAYYVARVVTEERLRERKHKPVEFYNVNFNWLRPIVKNLVGLFL